MKRTTYFETVHHNNTFTAYFTKRICRRTGERYLAKYLLATNAYIVHNYRIHFICMQLIVEIDSNGVGVEALGVRMVAGNWKNRTIVLIFSSKTQKGHCLIITIVAYKQKAQTLNDHAVHNNVHSLFFVFFFSFLIICMFVCVNSIAT